jgi:hypothetical protein
VGNLCRGGDLVGLPPTYSRKFDQVFVSVGHGAIPIAMQRRYVLPPVPGVMEVTDCNFPADKVCRNLLTGGSVPRRLVLGFKAEFRLQSPNFGKHPIKALQHFLEMLSR